MHATHTPCPSPPCRSTDESYGVSAPRSTAYTPQRQIFWNLRKMHPLQPGRMLAVPPSTRLPIRRPASVGKRVPARLNWERLAPVAQGIEQWFPKPRVGGSNPSRRTPRLLIDMRDPSCPEEPRSYAGALFTATVLQPAAYPNAAS